MPAEIKPAFGLPQGPLLGIHKVALDRPLDFVDLAYRFAHMPGTVVLLSGGEQDCARYHLLGVLPWLTLKARLNEVELTVNGRHQIIRDNPLAIVQTILRHYRLPGGKWPRPMAAGLMGYLSYDLKDCLERLPRTSVDDLHLPSVLLYAPSVLAVHDKQTRRTRLLLPQQVDQKDGVARAIDKFYQIADTPPQDAGSFCAAAHHPTANFTQTAYEKAVQTVIDYIAAGDVYQVNLSQRFQVPFQGDAFSLFRHLFEENPAPFFAYVQAGDHQIVSTSPERFLLRQGSRVETRPIKGTRPRGRTPLEDDALRTELADSAKDDAELSMIVDLLRNDLGKVCRPGSVKVSEHKRLEAYQNVYHLVSIVEGLLEEGLDDVDLIRAAFPGGSITGCPKVRAMEIIDELETCRRHVYCGSIGYIGFHDCMDLSIAIRTATAIDGTLFFSVGGGIVYDSNPLAEYEETLHKGRTLTQACQGAGARKDASTMIWQNGRLIPLDEAAVPVTDEALIYGFGFFETIRADNGHIPLLAFHLDRFARTWRDLMPGEPPDVTWPDIIAQVLAANGLHEGPSAIKVLATRGSRQRPPWDNHLLVSARNYTHRLAAIGKEGLDLGTYPHGRQTPLAAYKTLNYLYYLRAGRWAKEGGFDEALILNPDGTLSETNTANLVLINGRQVIRPDSPAVLPGVMTEAVARQLAAWDYHLTERPVQPAELLSADQVLATNALMGSVPVIAIDGRPRPAGGDLWQRLNDALIPGWRQTAVVSSADP